MKYKEVLATIVIVSITVVFSTAVFAAPKSTAGRGSFDFGISAVPSSGTVQRGQTANSTIAVTLLSGKATDVSLSILNCPASTICTVSPSSGKATYSSTLTVETTGSTPTGTSVITVRGTSKSKTYDTTYTLTVDYADSCSDTDGGNVIDVFGTASGYYNNNPFSDSDFCINDSSIAEYYCSGNYEQQQNQSCGTDGYVGSNYCMYGNVFRNYTDYYCGSGECGSTVYPVSIQNCTVGQYCSNGTCYNNNTCTDTDGGFVPSVLGTVYGTDNNGQYNMTDFCISNTTLMEYTCSGSAPVNYTFDCTANSTYCYSGRCV